MEATALAITSTAAAVWIGAIVFQSAVVAPVVFVNLDEAHARVFLRTLFPRLFKLGLVCGATMSVGMLWLGLASGWSSSVFKIGTASLLMLTLGALSLWMVPRINAARDAGSEEEARFRRLHRVNVSLTMLIMLLGIAILCLIAQQASTGV